MGLVFLITSSTICTSEAITTMNEMIRRYGASARMNVFRNHAASAVSTITNSVAKPSRRAVSIRDDTPMKGQSPRKYDRTKLLTTIDETKIQAKSVIPPPFRDPARGA